MSNHSPPKIILYIDDDDGMPGCQHARAEPPGIDESLAPFCVAFRYTDATACGSRALRFVVIAPAAVDTRSAASPAPTPLVASAMAHPNAGAARVCLERAASPPSDDDGGDDVSLGPFSAISRNSQSGDETGWRRRQSGANLSLLNSLLTGNLTGNFDNSEPRKSHFSSLSRRFQGENPC